MPELPEVETVVRGLRSILLGRRIIAVEVKWPRAVVPSVDVLLREIPHKRIEQISRRGKYIIFHLDPAEIFLIIHLKMSGSLLYENMSTQPHPHVRTIFSLDNDYQLRFKDMRKFGRVYVVSDPAEIVGKLGPEPLRRDFTRQACRELFLHRRGKLKPLLLNQEFIAGLGNIYADESCFYARVHPTRLVQTLTEENITRLYHGIRNALSLGIAHNGASLDEIYRGGDFQNHFRVYQRTGQPCLRCHSLIQRMVLAGRSTHFCPSCQQ